MKIGITFKLFAAILATSIGVVAVVVLAQHFTFRRDFLAYLNRTEVARIESLAEALAARYEADGGWESLRNARRRWWHLVMTAMRDEAAWAEGRAGPRPPLRTPPVDPLRLGPRLTLLDAERRLVAGNPLPAGDAAAHPIKSAGRTVGWLVVTPFTELTRTVDVHFQQRQARAAVLSAAVAIVLAAIAALVLARHLLRPVRALARGTQALAVGRLDTRIEAGTRDELGRLAEDFNLLARTLQRNEQARRELGADIAHELRTPIAVLRGEIEALEDGVRPLGREALASLRQEIALLGKLVDDLHELALSDAGALAYRRESLDLRELLATAVDACRPRFADRGIAIELDRGDAPLPVLADPHRLRQLFANLLENSLRYTDPGGRLRIACRAVADTVEVDFQDSAPGVPEAALPRLFERLFRVERSRSRRHGGAGLGLAICRNIAEAHGGRIEARPSPLGGLWVALALPRRDPERAA